MSTPKQRPLLFSAPMVRAILEGRKTQTRRIVKLHEVSAATRAEQQNGQKFPYGKPGDQLWVKETWKPDPSWGQSNAKTMEIQEGSNILYRATLPEGHAKHEFGKWRPCLFMRRWMSRITLEIESVRVERLQDISEADAIAEGCDNFTMDEGVKMWSSACEKYAALWDSINDKNPPRGEIRQGPNPNSWDGNPWVWVIEFRKL